MVLFLSLGCIISVSFLGGEKPPIIYAQDVYIIIVECVDGLCECHLKSLILLVRPEFLLNMRGAQGGQV